MGVAQAMATKKPVVRDDATLDEGVPPEVPLIVKEHGFQGTVLVPMVSNEQSIGVLSVMDKRIRHFTEAKFHYYPPLPIRRPSRWKKPGS